MGRLGDATASLSRVQHATPSRPSACFCRHLAVSILLLWSSHHVYTGHRRRVCTEQVLQLWEVLWAYSWQQRHCAEQHAQAAPPAASDGGQHKAPISPSSASTAAAAVDSGKSECSSHDDGSAEQSSCTVLADGRASAAAKQSKGTAGGAANNSSLQQQPHLDLFVCFVAEVITAQRRTILDHCYNADDVLRLFHGLRHIDLWQCLGKAHTLLGVVQKH